MAVADDLNAAVAALTFNAINNAPIAPAILAQLQAVVAEMSPGSPLDELNDALAQLSWAAANNAPASQHLLDELNDVSSQLTYGTQTTNPDDLDAINQLTNAILAKEPDWAPLLWINWDQPSTTLTVQVRDMATLQMVCSASPWWSAWDNFDDASDDLIGSIYFQAIPVPPASTTMQACEIDPRSGPPWTGSGWIYAWNQTYAARAGQGLPVGHIAYMAVYFGVTQEALALDVNLAVWPGMQPEGSASPDGSICVLQPVLMRTPSSTRDKFNRLQWWMSSDINGTDASGLHGQNGTTPVAIAMPTGVWGVIREYAGYWMIGFFKGNRGNTGPAFGKPYPGTVYYVSLTDPFYGHMVNRPFHYPVCVMEVPAPANAPYDCTNLNITAVFGGITIMQNGHFPLPVNWTHGQNLGLSNIGINCGTKESIQYPTSNGYTQLTLAYSASTLPPP